MSRDNLGSKQTIVLYNCSNKNKRYDLVITPHRQTKGFIRSKKKQNTKKGNHNKNNPKKYIKRQFSKQRNAVSESETNTIQKLYDLKDLINKNNPIDDQTYFLTQKPQHHHQ